MEREKVITLQNGSRLNKQQFIRYFDKKVLYTIRKFDLFRDIPQKQKPQIKELFKIKKVGKYTVSKECLDDISVLILINMMKSESKKNLSSLLPSYKKIIRPFFFMSKREINLYARLKNIRIVQSNLSRVKQNKKNYLYNSLVFFLNELEKQQKNVKNSIVSSLLKISPFIDN